VGYKTLVDVFVNSKSKDIGITFIEGSDKDEYLSYQSLYNHSLNVLAYLQSKGIRQGDELVLQLENPKTFIIVFWACILGGIIPVPLTLGRNDDYRLKLFNVWEILNNPHLIISQQNLEKLQVFAETKNLLHNFEKLSNSKVLEEAAFKENRHGKIHYPDENDIAYVQFSSGSTGDPKGVTLSHKNLLTNSLALLKGAKSPKNGEILFSWMPLTHDMGLIGLHITPFVAGWQHYIMPTELFIRRPSLWLQKISEYKATVTASPNFGYRYLINRLNQDSIKNIDLSTLRLIFNGAEPIAYDLCQEFIKKLQIYDLKENVIFPVYGLAEASLAVTLSEPEKAVEKLTLNRRKLNKGDQVIVTKSNDGIDIVNVGKPVENCNIRIIIDNKQAGDKVIGNIQIKGDNVTSGYYNNTLATSKIKTKDGWLDTGDLGFIYNGSLYITGRAKDIIFIYGQNYYPHDIERQAEEIDGIELGKIAVTGYFDEKAQKDEVIAFVLHKGKLEDFVPIVINLKKHIVQCFGFEIDKIIQVKEIPKTTSGKIKRFKLKENYINGLYTEICDKIDYLVSEKYSCENLVSPNEIEKRLVAAWQDILGVENIGIDDNFFQLGGNSLNISQLSVKANELFGKEIKITNLIQYPTIRLFIGHFNGNNKNRYDFQYKKSKETYNNTIMQLRRKKNG
jgi:acyl-CoA synthetase (AMP-forming)/AMP-acid ligase II/acyl carrier protein